MNVFQRTSLLTAVAMVTAALATSPVLALPLVWARGERVSARAVLGASAALAGVALLLMR